jgi:thioredoxin-like negative regulator of GroEL
MFQRTAARGVDTRHLHAAVFSLLDARAFLPAKMILESLLALGDRSPTMQLAYATCLIETGQGEQAGRILERLKELLNQAPLRGNTKARAALASISERLPGRRWDPARLESLSSDAARMIPTLRK